MKLNGIILYLASRLCFLRKMVSNKTILSAFIALCCAVLPSSSYAFKEKQESSKSTPNLRNSVRILPADTKMHKDALKLDWIDLIPEKEREQFDEIGMPIINHNDPAPTQVHVGGVRPELNGTKVKIPGFVIPLEGDENVITEFLLVPYFGACIHVPPPPTNQIIYVKFKQGAPVQELWDIVYVVGTLKTEVQHHDLADTAYVIDGTALIQYDDDNTNE